MADRKQYSHYVTLSHSQHKQKYEINCENACSKRLQDAGHYRQAELKPRKELNNVAGLFRNKAK